LDATDGNTITSSGGSVSQWDDKSGSGNDVTQGTGSAQPTTDSATIDGKNALSFDGGDHLSGALGLAGTEFTVFVVAERVAAVGSSSTLVGVSDGQANDFDNEGSCVFFDEGGSAVVFQTFSNSVTRSAGTNVGNGSPYIIATKCDGTNNTLYINGTAETPVATTNTFDFDTVYVGTRFVGSAVTAQYNGKIAEVLVYDRSLSDPERISVETYLSNKWAISVETPLNLSPLLWLDASDEDTIVSSGGSVSQWNDKSGNGNNATQGTGSAQPATGSTTQNGLNVLDFDGGDELMLPSGVYTIPTGSNTIFVVSKLAAEAGQIDVILGMGEVGVDNKYFLLYNPTAG
jgi:hypothetical protein